jgi:ABC-type glycerol-3-phosphate transport system permease component
MLRKSIFQGVTMTDFVYNPALFEKLGVPQPVNDWTRDDFAKTALFAMSTLSLIPLFAVFIFFQKYAIKGITAVSVKA